MQNSRYQSIGRNFWTASQENCTRWLCSACGWSIHHHNVGLCQSGQFVLGWCAGPRFVDTPEDASALLLRNYTAGKTLDGKQPHDLDIRFIAHGKPQDNFWKMVKSGVKYMSTGYGVRKTFCFWLLVKLCQLFFVWWKYTSPHIMLLQFWGVALWTSAPARKEP